MSFVRLRWRGRSATLDVVRSTRTSAGPRQRFVANLGTLQPGRAGHRALLDRARDRLARLPLAPAERAGVARSLCACLRRLGRVVAAQYEVMLAIHAADPRPRLASLQGCSVDPLDPAVARSVIMQHEWLGSTGNSRFFFGLIPCRTPRPMPGAS